MFAGERVTVLFQIREKFEKVFRIYLFSHSPLSASLIAFIRNLTCEKQKCIMTFFEIILFSTIYYFFRKIFLHFSADNVDKNFRKHISYQTGHLQRNLRKSF